MKPIKDFFVYIPTLNNPPINYICDTRNNLNKGTKGKSIYLCYLRINYNIDNDNNSLNIGYDNLDNNENTYDEQAYFNQIKIISSLDIVYSLKKTISCPIGHEIVNEGCDEDGCDLNHKSGGYYIYLCQKKQLLSQLTLNQKPI